jgi:hypothetical protein
MGHRTGSIVSPKEIEHFISETDRIILRHTTAEYHVLDILRDNRQLVVKGGPGSGKAWLALEQAFRYANEGLRVLLLCYNVALADQLSALVVKRKYRKGEVIVRSWESLARELLVAVGVGWDEPTGLAEREIYVGEVVRSLCATSYVSRNFSQDSMRWLSMKLKITIPLGRDRNRTKPNVVGGRFTGSFFGRKRKREWLSSTIRNRGHFFAKRSDLKPRVFSKVCHNRRTQTCCSPFVTRYRFSLSLRRCNRKQH